MSLINQMLKDLDRRRQESAGESSRQWPPVDPPRKEERFRRAGLLLVLALILVALLSVGWLLVRPRLEVEEVPAGPSLARTPAPPVTAPSPAAAPADLPAREPETAATGTAVSSPSLPAAAPEPEPAPARQASPPPKPAAERAAIATPGSEGEAGGSSAPAAGSQAPPQRQGPELVRRPRTPSPAERAEEFLRNGRLALAEDRRGEAESSLRRALELRPDLHPARRALAGLFLAGGRLEEAQALLRQGLELDPADPVFRQGYARLLVEQGEPEAAHGLLAAAPRPRIEEAADYYALLAVVRQELGDPAGAAAIYRQLVELRPAAGTWWLGLAAALEGNGERPKALQAYRRALQTPDLSPALRRFALERLEDARHRPPTP